MADMVSTLSEYVRQCREESRGSDTITDRPQAGVSDGFWVAGEDFCDDRHGIVSLLLDLHRRGESYNA